MADQRTLGQRALNLLGEATLLAGMIVAFPGAMLILASTWLLIPKDPSGLGAKRRF